LYFRKNFSFAFSRSFVLAKRAKKDDPVPETPTCRACRSINSFFQIRYAGNFEKSNVSKSFFKYFDAVIISSFCNALMILELEFDGSPPIIDGSICLNAHGVLIENCGEKIRILSGIAQSKGIIFSPIPVT
jgi:hypothetical protein